jgi:hypothetical protein
MSSLDVESLGPHKKTGLVACLLDPAFGFFVWSAHFLIVYVATAVLCALGPRTADVSTRSTFLTALAVVTMAAAAVLVAHANLRYRQGRGLPDQRFREALTIGGDAIAAVAIVLQLLPLLLVPLCV